MDISSATLLHRIIDVAIMFLQHSINSIITVGIADHARKFNFTICHLYFSPQKALSSFLHTFAAILSAMIVFFLFLQTRREFLN